MMGFAMHGHRKRRRRDAKGFDSPNSQPECKSPVRSHFSIPGELISQRQDIGSNKDSLVPMNEEQELAYLERRAAEIKKIRDEEGIRILDEN